MMAKGENKGALGDALVKMRIGGGKSISVANLRDIPNRPVSPDPSGGAGATTTYSYASHSALWVLIIERQRTISGGGVIDGDYVFVGVTENGEDFAWRTFIIPGPNPIGPSRNFAVNSTGTNLRFRTDNALWDLNLVTGEFNGLNWRLIASTVTEWRSSLMIFPTLDGSFVVGGHNAIGVGVGTVFAPINLDITIRNMAHRIVGDEHIFMAIAGMSGAWARGDIVLRTGGWQDWAVVENSGQAGDITATDDGFVATLRGIGGPRILPVSTFTVDDGDTWERSSVTSRQTSILSTIRNKSLNHLELGNKILTHFQDSDQNWLMGVSLDMGRTWLTTSGLPGTSGSVLQRPIDVNGHIFGTHGDELLDLFIEDVSFGRIRNFYLDANPVITGYIDPDEPGVVKPLEEGFGGERFIPYREGVKPVGTVYAVDDVIDDSGALRSTNPNFFELVDGAIHINQQLLPGIAVGVEYVADYNSVLSKRVPCGIDRTDRHYRPTTGHSVPGNMGVGRGLAVHPNNRMVAIGNQDGVQFAQLDVNTRIWSETHRIPRIRVEGLSYSHSGKFLAVPAFMNPPNSLQVYECDDDGRPINLITLPFNPPGSGRDWGIRATDWSFDDRYLIVSQGHNASNTQTSVWCYDMSNPYAPVILSTETGGQMVGNAPGVHFIPNSYDFVLTIAVPSATPHSHTRTCIGRVSGGVVSLIDSYQRLGSYAGGNAVRADGRFALMGNAIFDISDLNMNLVFPNIWTAVYRSDWTATDLLVIAGNNIIHELVIHDTPTGSQMEMIPLRDLQDTPMDGTVWAMNRTNNEDWLMVINPANRVNFFFNFRDGVETDSQPQQTL